MHTKRLSGEDITVSQNLNNQVQTSTKHKSSLETISSPIHQKYVKQS